MVKPVLELSVEKSCNRGFKMILLEMEAIVANAIMPVLMTDGY